MSKVLLIDNESTRVAPIRESLERGGFETLWAANGNEALKLFLNEVPDLVMAGPLAANPEENVCRQLRETRPGTRTPIILYSETLGTDALKAALEHSGCNVYLKMPASDERLMEVCRHALVESVGAVPAETPVSTVTVEAPVFTSPDAAVAELESSGKDIDDHLDSMFGTGEPRVSPTWTAEPALSLETDMAEMPVEHLEHTLAVEPAEPSPAVEPVAASPEENLEAPGLDADTSADDPEPEVELVGFESDAVTFEQEGEVNPGIEPEIVSEAESLATADVPAPPEPEFTPIDAGLSIASDEPTLRRDQPAGPEPSSVDFSIDGSTEESPTVEWMTEPSPKKTGGSRRWWWVVFAAALIGGVGLFFVYRPMLLGDTNQAESTSASRPSAARTGGVDFAQPTAAANSDSEQAPEISQVAAAGDPPAATPAAPIATPESTPDTASSPDDSVVEPETAETTVGGGTLSPEPETASVASPPRPSDTPVATPTISPLEMTADTTTAASDAATPPDTTAVPPKPAEKAVYVFVPSNEIVDPATAGDDFTPPKSINRVPPTYNAAEVPEGGQTVVLRVLVNDWGKAVRVDVESGPPSGPLVEAAINAVLNTRYQPAVDGERQVRAWATETFVFE